jgi:hypothetical protein
VVSNGFPVLVMVFEVDLIAVKLAGFRRYFICGSYKKNLMIFSSNKNKVLTNQQIMFIFDIEHASQNIVFHHI